MTSVSFSHATHDGYGYIADNMRDADRTEIRLTAGQLPIAALMAGFKNGYEVQLDGVPAIAFGVSRGTLLSGAGIPWLLATDAIATVPVTFARQSRKVLAELSKDYDYLSNVVWAGNHLSIKWLTWLGFELSPPIEHNGNTFFRFKKLCAHPQQSLGYTPPPL